MIKINKLKPNDDNPRIISQYEIEKLKKSISSFDDMMTVNKIVVDENWLVLAGNQRINALKLLGYKEIPKEWVRIEKKFTEEQKKRFIVIDNTHVGLWDLDELKNGFSAEILIETGFGYLNQELKLIKPRDFVIENKVFEQEKEKKARSIALEFHLEDYEDNVFYIMSYKSKGVKIGKELKFFINNDK
jgi:ParB-like nuclease domain